MDAMRQLVHCLPEAKYMAREFADMMDTCTPEEVENMKQLEGEIYYNVLELFEGASVAWPIQYVLIVSIFNGKAYIWLKHYFRDDQCEGDCKHAHMGIYCFALKDKDNIILEYQGDGGWVAYRSGYCFGLNDDENAILEYATDCIHRADEEKTNMKNQLEQIAARVGMKRPAE